MPIVINLLADEQAAEEMRRNDPTKQAAFIAGFVALLVVVLNLFLQTRVWSARSSLSGLEEEWTALEPKEKEVQELIKSKKRTEANLEALHQLAVERFLWSDPLNALQFALVPDVEIVGIQSDQNYAILRPKKTGKQKVPDPATATEKIVLTIKAKDFGDPADQNYNKFRQAIAQQPFFNNSLGGERGVRLSELGAPQVIGAVAPTPGTGTVASSKMTRFALFTLECTFPDKVRK